MEAACALTPLLNRAAVLAAQCCALAIKGRFPWLPSVVPAVLAAVAVLLPSVCLASTGRTLESRRCPAVLRSSYGPERGTLNGQQPSQDVDLF